MRRLSFYLLLAFVFAVPWENAIQIGGSKTLSSMIGIAAVGIALVRCLFEGKTNRPPLFLFAFGALVTWQLTSYFWSLDPAYTLVRVATMLQLLAMIWLVAESCTSERERLLVVQAFVVGCIVVCLALVYAYFSGQSIDQYRYAPSEFSVNESADVIAAGIPMALLIAVNRNSFLLRWLNVAYVPLGVIAVVLTASRSGFIATSVGLTSVFFALRAARPLYRLAGMVAILAVFAGVFFLVPADIGLDKNIQRITFSTDTESLGSLTGRTTIWSTGLQAFSEHPAAGVGFGTFSQLSQIKFARPRAAHNIWIQTAAETGIVGVALLVMVLGAAVAPALKRRDSRAPFHVILFLTLMTASLAANVVGSKSLWIALGILSVTQNPRQDRVGEGKTRTDFGTSTENDRLTGGSTVSPIRQSVNDSRVNG